MALVRAACLLFVSALIVIGAGWIAYMLNLDIL